MPLLVSLKPAAAFAGPPALRSEMVRRLIDGPTPLAELLAIDGADIAIVASLLDGLPPQPRRALVVELHPDRAHALT